MSLATDLVEPPDRAPSASLAQKTDLLAQDFATRADRHDAEGSFIGKNTPG